MNEQDSKLMAQYGITAETKFLFHYGGYRYERLADAIKYARLQKTEPETDGDRVVPDHEN